jgi:hypothetical protein
MFKAENITLQIQSSRAKGNLIEFYNFPNYIGKNIEQGKA